MAAPMRSVWCFARTFLARNTRVPPISLRMDTREVTSYISGTQRSAFHTTPKSSNMMEFFDDKDNWGKDEVKVGRPWRKDELRLKSNTDLHKLWYVLLKERNMIMTMQEEYKRNSELLPSPERLEKVEESMENVLDVIAERDRAVNMLETGRTGEPEPYLDKDILGRTYTRIPKEYYRPAHLNPAIIHKKKMLGRWQEKFLVRWEEKKRREERGREKYIEKKKQKLREIFPNADID